MREPTGEGGESTDQIEEPDYTGYTLQALRDVRSHMDAELYPGRAARVEAEIARRMANPGKYEPAGRTASDWWPRHWPRVLGILGIVIGVLGVLSHAGGLAAVFRPGPAEGAHAGAAAGDGGAGGGSSSGEEEAGTPDGEAGEEGSRAGKEGGGGASGSMIWIMPTAAVAIPGEAPRWFLASSAGTRFAGVVISVVVLCGGFLLARRREEGVFWLITGLVMALALNFLEQGLRTAAGVSGAAPAALGFLLGLLWNGTLIALAQTGRREALR